MPVINEMFPGTAKYREPLKEAYTILESLRPVNSSKSIRYKVMKGNGDEQYMGAEDANFRGNWEVIIGKDVSREKGVDLSDIELLANCIVNMCFISNYPKRFEQAHQALLQE